MCAVVPVVAGTVVSRDLGVTGAISTGIGHAVVRVWNEDNEDNEEIKCYDGCDFVESQNYVNMDINWVRIM